MPAGTIKMCPGANYVPPRRALVRCFPIATPFTTVPTIGELGRIYPVTLLNGWGINGHIGPYEGGVDQGWSWGLNADYNFTYSNPDNVFDGSLSTAASAVGQATHRYFGCIWKFSNPYAGITPTQFKLNVYSEVPYNGKYGLTITDRSAGIWYSTDNGTSWHLVYDAHKRTAQWDYIWLPATIDTTQLQVMAFMDTHDDLAHYIFEISLSVYGIVPPYTPGANSTGHGQIFPVGRQ